MWGGETEVWGWIMWCFSQKSRAPEQAGRAGQWSSAARRKWIWNELCPSESRIASWRLWQEGVSPEDHWSMLCCVSLLILPLSHGNYSSQVSTGAINLCTINQEMCLWPIISLIVGEVINISRVETGLMDAGCLVCWSQQHSPVTDFLLSHLFPFSNEPEGKQEGTVEQQKHKDKSQRLTKPQKREEKFRFRRVNSDF